jgi:hypothetical protein
LAWRRTTSVAAITTSFAALTLQMAVASHPHCASYCDSEGIRSAVAKITMDPTNRKNIMTQMRIEMCSFFEKV